MIRALFVALCLVLYSPEVRAEDKVVYTASPWQIVRDGDDLIIGFNIRVEGEAYTVTDFRFSKNSRYKLYFEERIKADELEYCYFEITTNKPIQRSRSLMPPRLDIITKETMKDLAEYTGSRDGRLFETAISDEMIVSVRRITQNEFLHVNPAIVPDPTK